MDALQDLLVQELEHHEHLVLRARYNLCKNREMCEKGLDFDRSHLARMSVVVKENKSTNPVDVRLLGPDRVMEKL